MSDSSIKANRPRRLRFWIGTITIIVLTVAAVWLFQRQPDSPTTNPFRPGAMGAMKVPVRVAPVEKSTIDVVFKAIGTVTASNTVTVHSRVEGELQAIFFKDGQKVNEGDLLAQIDPRTYQVQLDQALGQQKQNAAQLQNARRDLQRYQTLFKQNSIARQQVDAQAALVQQYLGMQKSDQAAVDSAQLQLSFTKITAPISGRLGLRLVDQGNLVSPSNTDGLVVITQTQPISVVFTLPQAQLGPVLSRFRAGSELKVELYDSTDTQKIATGRLISVDNQIDVATGTLKLKASFDNQDEALFPNQFVNVKLIVNQDEAATVIPTKAVQQGSKGAFVYVVADDNTVHVQPVVTATVDGDRVAISAGLTPGQQVVTEGVDRLREGAAVDIVKDEAATDVNRPAPIGSNTGQTPASNNPAPAKTPGSGSGRRGGGGGAASPH